MFGLVLVHMKRDYYSRTGALSRKIVLQDDMLRDWVDMAMFGWYVAHYPSVVKPLKFKSVQVL